MKKRIAVLGSTGSIGTQTLEVISENPELFEATVLTAGGNADLLIKQALKYLPDTVVIADESKYEYVKNALALYPIKVYAGSAAVEQVAAFENIDIVLIALVGYSGLLPVINAAKASKLIALANKESLVVGGNIVMNLVTKHRAAIIPVDSEHSAIFQCLAGENAEIDKIYLTASGGPFLNTPVTELKNATREQALKHPRWSMGSKITIDSATMMNKGFEVIEARWLFDLPADRIDVIIHPQSIIHSMVQFTDGAIKAQLGEPSMKVPIQYAFTYPERTKSDVPRIAFDNYPSFTFIKPDFDKFRCLALAYEALKKAGNAPCIVNAANEIAVEAFLEGKISFDGIAKTIEKTMQKATFKASPSLADYIASNTEAREIAASMI